MSTRYTENPRRTLIQEAADPATDTERLRELAEHEDEDVRLAAIQNPGVPEDVWRKALLEGDPEAWSNPMAPIYLLVWSPKPGDQTTLEEAAYWTGTRLWKNPARCSPDGKVLLNVQLINWWAASVSARPMMNVLLAWASTKQNGSDEHRVVVRMLVLCVRTMPSLTDKDLQALDLIDAWCAGGKDLRREAYFLTSLSPIQITAEFASDTSNSFIAWDLVSTVLLYVVFDKSGKKRKEAMAEHDRLLADLIRREMPLPPQFE